MYSISRHFYPKQLTSEEYNKWFIIIKRQVNIRSAHNTKFQSCSELVQASQGGNEKKRKQIFIFKLYQKMSSFSHGIYCLDIIKRISFENRLFNIKSKTKRIAIIAIILQRVVRTAERIIGTTHPLSQELYLSTVSKGAGKITLDPSDPAHSLFELLPSGRCYGAPSTRTTRHTNSFFPQAINLMNTWQ